MNDFVTAFIHSILPDVEVEFEDDEFRVNIEERIINIGVDPDPEGDRLIQEFVFDKFGVAMDSFLIGVLHEIGHIMTYDEEINAEGNALYFLLRMNYEEMNHEDYSIMYFNIPSEYRATEWAVNYYLTHRDKCDEFCDMVL